MLTWWATRTQPRSSIRRNRHWLASPELMTAPSSSVPSCPLFAEVFGSLDEHADLPRLQQDIYRLLVTRSRSRGWLSSPEQDRRAGRWGMNDAGSDVLRADESGRVAWAQVSVEGFQDCTTPLHLLLACMEDVVSRFATIRLQALNLVIPIFGRQESQAAILENLNWFERSVEQADFAIVVGTGQGPSAPEAASKILERVSSTLGRVYEFYDIHPVDDVRVASGRNVIDPSVWNVVVEGGGLGRIRAPEWSLDFLALIARSVVHAAHDLGRSYVTVSFSKESEPVAAS